MKLLQQGLGIALAALPSLVIAQTPTVSLAPASVAATAQGDVAVTIYNNIALVQDVRQVALPLGRSRQEFLEVSAQIRPETVTLAGEGFGIIEQNFDFDLLSPAALMEKAVGQEVTLLRTNPATGVETRERAQVLSANGGAVIKIGDRIEVLRDDGLPVRVIFDSIPPNLRARPTLSVTLNAARAGVRPLTLSYLTPRLGWKADYVALFDESANKINVQGWITLSNQTGTTFNNARILLVAGEAATLQQNRSNSGRSGQPTRSITQTGTETNPGETLGDFAVYPIEARTTIANAQTKQVSFLDASGVPARKTYNFINGWMHNSLDPMSVDTVLKFSNARATGIGAALPEGVVRVYMRDARGQAQFAGESSIPNTPGGSLFALRIGAAFDVKVRPIMEKREVITSDEWQQSARFRVTNPNGEITETRVETPRSYYRTQMRYIVTNARPVGVSVDVSQAGLARRDAPETRVSTESIAGTQDGAGTRRWEVLVPANGKTELTATFLTSW